MTPSRRNAKSQIPVFHEDTITMSDDKKIIYGLNNINKLIKRAAEIGYSFEYEGDNYPEYIHDLWQSFLKNPILKERSKTIEQKLGLGDTIQLLSDTILDLYASEFKAH